MTVGWAEVFVDDDPRIIPQTIRIMARIRTRKKNTRKNDGNPFKLYPQVYSLY